MVPPPTIGTEPAKRLDSLLVNDGDGTGTEPPDPGKGKGRTCFVADTPVMVNGKLVQISQATASQTIGSVEEHEGTFVCRDIALESGNIIGVVDSHRFMLVSGQWIAAQNLTSGQRLKTLTGTVSIKRITMRSYTGKVYNLKIRNSEQYLVGKDGIVVRDW